MKYYLRIIGLLLIYNGCAHSPVALGETDSKILIEKADSLLTARPGDLDLQASIIKARLDLAKTSGDMNQYQEVLKIDPRNATANYHIHMAKGWKDHKKGHKNGQWDAIQSFAKAAALIDSLGEPHFWLGQAYEKKDEMDFELPLEAYNKALSLYLADDLKPKVETARTALLKRKKTYEDFWK